MASMREDDKPWKTDLARKSAQRREQVLQDIEEAIKKAPSFEEALRQAVEIMKRKFARYSAVTAYVADGEDLAVHISLDRPQGPERVWSGGGPLADAAHGHAPTRGVGSRRRSPPGRRSGLATGSAMVAPVRTEAGLWAILEVWSDFRDAFTPQDVKLLDQRGRGPRQEDPRRLSARAPRVQLRGVIPPLVTPFHSDGGARSCRLRGQPRVLRGRGPRAATWCSARTARPRASSEDEKLALVRAARARARLAGRCSSGPASSPRAPPSR